MYADGLSRLAHSIGGDIPIDKITRVMLQDHLDSERARGLAPKTLNIRRQNITALFHFLIDEELLEIGPTVKLVPIPVPSKVPDPFDTKDVQKMVNFLDDGTPEGRRNQLLALLMVDSGGRVSEVANIRIDDIDLQRSRIRVEQKGGDEESLNLTDGTKLALLRYVRKLMVQECPPEDLFENPATGRPITRGAIYKIIRNAGEQNRIKKSHPHRLRTTFASGYANSSGDPYALQRELRHKDIQTSLKYVKVFDDALHRKHQLHSPAAKLVIRRKQK